MADWFAVQVASGKEEPTCCLMRRLVGADVLPEVFTPRFETQKKYQGEWRMCQSVLFPGYIIAVTPKVDVLRTRLARVPEFTRVLTMGETYLPLEAADRAWIEALTSRKKRTVEMSRGVMEGERVVVTSGPLMGHEGWITGVNRQKSLAFLEIEMFGRKLKTKVGLAILAKRPGARPVVLSSTENVVEEHAAD